MGFKNMSLGQLVQLLEVGGPKSAKEITEKLRISQPSFSRAVSSMPGILKIGSGRSCKYALKRQDESYPIVKVSEDAQIQPVGEIYLLKPKGAALIPHKSAKDVSPEIYEDIPFYIWDIRPQGFLGKIFVKQNQDLALPEQWQNWKESDLYRSLKTKGDQLSGNLIIGNQSLKNYQLKKSVYIEEEEKSQQYASLADKTLKGAHAGSSAGGEQPKFTTILHNKKFGHRHVIVKFSQPIDSEAGKRWADLLYSEQIALKLLASTDHPATQAEAMEIENRIFLELTRFDRVESAGRKGIISLGAVDDEYVGARANWTSTAIELKQKKMISEKSKNEIIFLNCFGHMIANSDMHFGNLSLYWEPGQKKLQVAPVYDMLPMFYAPVQGNIVDKTFAPPPQSFEQMEVWNSAKALATEFWQRLTKDDRISSEFKKIAQENASILDLS